MAWLWAPSTGIALPWLWTGVTGTLKSIFICAGKIQIASITQRVLEVSFARVFRKR